MCAHDWQVLKTVVHLRAQGWAWPDIAELVALPLHEVEDLPWRHRRSWQRAWQFAIELQRQESLRCAIVKVEATLLAATDPKTVATLTNSLARLLKLQEPPVATTTTTKQPRTKPTQQSTRAATTSAEQPAGPTAPLNAAEPSHATSPVRPATDTIPQGWSGVGGVLGAGIVALVVALFGLLPLAMAEQLAPRGGVLRMVDTGGRNTTSVALAVEVKETRCPKPPWTKPPNQTT